MNTSYVVKSRETDRFVNEFHDHKEELRSSNELLTDLQRSERSEPHGEERGTNSIKETCALESIKKTCASPLSIPPAEASPYTKRTIPTNERTWKVVHTHSPDGGNLATAVSKMVTQMVLHNDHDERQLDG